MRANVRNALALMAVAVPMTAAAAVESQLGPTILSLAIEKQIPPGNLSLKNVSTSKVASKRELGVLGDNPKFTV